MGSGGWGVQVRTIKYGMQLNIKNGPLFKKRIGTFGKEISQIYYEVDVKKEIYVDAVLLNLPTKSS